ncbi:MICOS complex subunit MIC19 [Liparis tanakae]|uniref:MICOS complex subunit MIC19 n=1 Tax=Liparis tanakae TaxID=230148 RepID=A0A4Z2G768_9TELE|nr:MICOS complex subunit MIC19 [Liparis tanakae]
MPEIGQKAKQLGAREADLNKQDAFYREQVARLEQRSAQFYKVTTENYHKAADQVNVKFSRQQQQPQSSPRWDEEACSRTCRIREGGVELLFTSQGGKEGCPKFLFSFFVVSLAGFGHNGLFSLFPMAIDGLH